MSTQVWNAEAYGSSAGFVAEFGKGALEWVTREAPARVLDLGCGDGVLTCELAARGYQVFGVDASPQMVAAARARGLDAACIDGQALSFSGEFDVVFSNATLHWLTRAEDTLKGVHRALRDGGSFVGEFGGQGNVQSVVSALEHELARRGVDGRAHNPWFFPSVAQYASLLEAHGFRVALIGTFARPTVLPGDVSAWIEMFGQHFTTALPEADRAEYVRDVREVLLPQLQAEDGRFTLDYVRLRFRATKLGQSA